MLLGTEINWKPLLLMVKEIDPSILRKHDEANKKLDYSGFFAIMRQAFPSFNPYSLVSCGTIIRIPLSHATLIADISARIKSGYREPYLFMHGDMNQWRDVMFHIKYYCKDEAIIIQFEEIRMTLKDIDKGLLLEH